MGSFAQATSVFDSTAGTSTALAFGSAVGAGSILIAYTDFDAATTGSVSDSVNGAWTAIDTPENWSGTHEGQAYLFVGTAAGTPTVTLTTAASSASRALLIAEYSGYGSLEASGRAIGNSGAGTTWTEPSLTPSLSTDAVIALGRGQVNPSAVAAPYTLRVHTNNVFLADHLAPTGGTPEAAVLTVSSGGWNAGLAALVLAATVVSSGPPPLIIMAPHLSY